MEEGLQGTAALASNFMFHKKIARIKLLTHAVRSGNIPP